MFLRHLPENIVGINVVKTAIKKLKTVDKEWPKKTTTHHFVNECKNYLFWILQKLSVILGGINEISINE